MEPPRRETVRSHECVCTVIDPNGVRNSCRSQVYNPDQPFCDYCEAARHDQLQAVQEGTR